MTTRELVLVPRDGLFCKDGRGWFTSSSHRGHALEWPYPSTVLGALRSLWGRARELQEGVRFRARDWPVRTADLRLGPTLPLRRRFGEGWTSAHRVWPAPADAMLVEDGAVHRLDPVPSRVMTMGADDDLIRERLWFASTDRQKPIRGRPWWGEHTFIEWLCGVEPTRFEELQLQRRIQTHVAISSAGVAGDGQLFSHDLVETVEADGEWGIGCHVSANDGAKVEVATLGSDRRLAAVHSIDAPIFGMPEQLAEAFARGSAGLRLVVITPASFVAGWLPDGLSVDQHEYRGRIPGVDVDVILRAAFVNRPLAISGWDMVAAAAKPGTRVVPPGSVYAFVRADNRPFTREHARALWLASIGARQHEGFGVVVPAIWNPQATPRS